VLPVSLDDCLFLIVPSFFSNVYLLSAQNISGGVGRGSGFLFISVGRVSVDRNKYFLSCVIVPLCIAMCAYVYTFFS